MFKVISATLTLLAACIVLVVVVLKTGDSGSAKEVANDQLPELPKPAEAKSSKSTTSSTVIADQPSPPTNDPRVANMQWLPGGRFEMGELNTVPDEFPPHAVELDGFWIDTTEVTNRQFKEFVAATGYLTTAERAPELRSIMPDSMPDSETI